MGFVIWQMESSFCIRKEYFAGLVKAAIQRFPDLFDEMSSVRDIFKEFDFEVDKDEKGNLDDIVFTGDRAGNEDELFEAIAPFVEAGSSVSFYGEDNSIWQYCFDGKQCRNESPLLIWPEMSPQTKGNPVKNTWSGSAFTQRKKPMNFMKLPMTGVKRLPPEVGLTNARRMSSSVPRMERS